MHAQTAQVREAWSRATNEEVLKAIGEDWNEYSAEAQAIINEEAQQRRLHVDIKPVTGLQERCLRSSGVQSHCALIVGVVVPCLLIGLIDLGLWRHYEHRDNAVIARLDELKVFLAAERNWLEGTEIALKQRDSAIEILYEKSYQGTNPPARSVKNGFDSLVSERDTLLREYQKRLAEYEEKVREYDLLRYDHGSRWYLIPIPFRTRG